jgi:hypothetical protein
VAPKNLTQDEWLDSDKMLPILANTERRAKQDDAVSMAFMKDLATLLDDL